MKEIKIQDLKQVSGGLPVALAAIPLGWKIFGGAAVAGISAGIAVGLNYVNRTKK